MRSKEQLTKIKRAIEEGKLQFYEMELLERLRNLKYNGVPLSILLTSSYCTNTWCFHYSFLLTRGMDSYTIIQGTTSDFQQYGDKISHGWVEKDGFVYDTTDCHKWAKEVYYDVFEARPMISYNEENWQTNPFYLELMKGFEIDIQPLVLETFFRVLEELEEKKPSLTHDFLLNEIEIYREQHPNTFDISKENVAVLKKRMFQK